MTRFVVFDVEKFDSEIVDICGKIYSAQVNIVSGWCIT